MLSWSARLPPSNRDAASAAISDPRLGALKAPGYTARSASFFIVVALLAAACRSEPPPQPKSVTLWKPVGSWSGHGDKQTESFTSDNGGFRVRWSANNETGAGMGRLHVVFRSGDSGREIIDAIDARGAGGGSEEVAADRPRWYYLTIESADEDWTVAVDERIDATTVR